MYMIPSGAQRPFYHKVITTILLVLLADFLFLNEETGWTIGLFATAVLAGILLHNPVILRERQGQAATGLTGGLCLAAVNNPSMLTVTLLALGLASLAVLSCTAWHRNATLWLESMVQFAGSLFYKLYSDLCLWRSIARCQPDSGRFAHVLKGWVLPVGFAIAFIFLFSEANPVIDGWISNIHPEKILKALTFQRILFWIICLAVCWGFIHPIIAEVGRDNQHPANPYWRGVSTLFRQDAVTRSLILFNLLFAVQTVLDAAYLFGDAALPIGLSFAEYAHRGAYPLVAAALLAGLFVLIAFRPGSDLSQNRTTKALVYLWIGQTILLVCSSIWRMALYVEVYSLTYLRVTAFIWMGLVACGLAWIIARIFWQRSNLWLINANALTLLATLYLCCFIPFGSLIAQYNARHNLEVAGKGHMLDLGYMGKIGVDALPALEWYQDHLPDAGSKRARHVLQLRHQLVSNLLKQSQNWRAWTWQSHRIKEQFANDLPSLPSQPSGQWNVE